MDAIPSQNHPKISAAVVTSLLEAMVNPDAPAMSQKQLAKYGMANDPFDMPLLPFIENIMDICTGTEVLCGLLYVRRLLKAPSSFRKTGHCKSLTRYNVHRIMFTAVVLANLQWNDVPYSTRAWSKWSTVWSRSSIMNMKLLFLKGVDWRLHIETSSFEAATAELEAMSKQSQ
eukprot:Rmarinus@m.7154